jgi:hypothetical protein
LRRVIAGVILVAGLAVIGATGLNALGQVTGQRGSLKTAIPIAVHTGWRSGLLLRAGLLLLRRALLGWYILRWRRRILGLWRHILLWRRPLLRSLLAAVTVAVHTGLLLLRRLVGIKVLPDGRLLGALLVLGVWLLPGLWLRRCRGLIFRINGAPGIF